MSEKTQKPKDERLKRMSQEQTKQARFLTLDEFNAKYHAFSDALGIIMEKPELFIEINGEYYYIPDGARLVVKSAATVQCVFK